MYLFSTFLHLFLCLETCKLLFLLQLFNLTFALHNLVVLLLNRIHKTLRHLTALFKEPRPTSGVNHVDGRPHSL